MARQQALAEQKRLEQEREERERKRAQNELQQIKDRQFKEKIQQISQTATGQKILQKIKDVSFLRSSVCLHCVLHVFILLQLLVSIISQKSINFQIISYFNYSTIVVCEENKCL